MNVDKARSILSKKKGIVSVDSVDDKGRFYLFTCNNSVGLKGYIGPRYYRVYKLTGLVRKERP